MDEHLISARGELGALSDEIAAEVDAFERRNGIRNRSRRAKDQAEHRKRIEVVACNLAYETLRPSETGRVALPLGHGNKGRSRYDSCLKSKGTSALISAMWELDWLDLRSPRAVRGEVTSISPSDRFVKKVMTMGVTLADFGRDPTREVIILSRRRRTCGKGTTREMVDYPETDLTRKLRKEVQLLNSNLDSFSIGFDCDGFDVVDVLDRHQRRYFTIWGDEEIDFHYGGRLFGGFWGNMRMDQRRRIVLQGEPVCELDYGSMFPRLAYAALGEEPPTGDIYAIPGLQHCRAAVKLAMNCLFFDDFARKRWPSEFDPNCGVCESVCTANQQAVRLPVGWTVNRFKTEVLKIHPCMEDVWGRGVGLKLMWMESQILLSVLRRLHEGGVQALGLHDGIIVPMSQAQNATKVMREVSQAIAGVALPVGLK